MRWILLAATGALGVYVSIRTIAALYGILDLWYAMRAAWPRVLAEVAAWSAVVLAAVLVLGRGPRAAFLAGLLGYAAFYLSLFPLRDVLIARYLGPRPGR